MKKHEPILKELRAIISMIRGYFVWKDEQRKRDRRAMGIITAHENQQLKNRNECLAKEIEAQDKIVRDCSAAAIKQQEEG